MSQRVESPSVPSWTAEAARYLSAPSNVLFLALVIVVAVLHAVVFVATMVISPIGFDEGFILQAPLNLVQGHGYSTEDWQQGGPKLPFDAIVSTGPAVGMPVALSFLMFGTSIEAARIVMLPYLVLLVVCLFVLGRRIAGRWGGLVAMLVPLALATRVDWPQTVIYGPSDALGEYATAALLTLGLVLLPRHKAWAGIAVGCATLAKFIAFMAVPAFVIAMLLVPAAVAATRWARLRAAAVFVGAVLVPTIVWELVKLVSLGLPGYMDALIANLRFIFRSGSGIDGGFRALFLDRLARLFAAWHLPTLLIIVLAFVLFAVAVVGLSRYWAGTAAARAWGKGNRAASAFGMLRAIPVEVLAALGTLAIVAIWWSFIASSTFIRHTMPVLLVTVPVVVALAVRGAQWMIQERAGGWRRVGVVFAAGLAVVATAQTAMTVAASFRAEEWTRAQQVEAAEFIRGLGVDDVQGAGWWASPELRFLSHVPSKPVGTGTGPLVIQPILESLDPATYQAVRDLCVDILYDEDGFIVCSVAPDQPPVELGQ